MIALAAGLRWQAGLTGLTDASRGYAFDVKPRWGLAELAVR
jgi:N6-L-threonylcarbamoyladenine synthase